MTDSKDGQVANEYSFRQRFEIAPGGRLPFEEKVRTVHESADGVVVELRSMEDKRIVDSVLISVWGAGLATEAEAAAVGKHWRGVMQRALAGVDLGANFGLRNASMGGFTDEVFEQLKADTGITVYRDSWDLMVFPSDPPPRFSSGTAEGIATSPPSLTMTSITASNSIEEAPNEVAFDLYSASMRSGHMADVRLVLLVMAIECLVERVKRPEPTRILIDRLVEITVSEESIEAEERDRLANALRGLRYESTRMAVKSLSQTLHSAAYPEDPKALIQEAFDMRNALVHGRKRPDLDRVRYVGPNLERMVGDLIAGPSVAGEVGQARLDLK